MNININMDGCNTGRTIHYKCYEPLEMGLIFSDKVITPEDITLDMHKKKQNKNFGQLGV